MKTLVLATVSAFALAAGAASAQSANNVDAGIASSKAGYEAFTLQASHGGGSGGPASLYDSSSYVVQIGDQNRASVDQQTAGSLGRGAVDANYTHPLTTVVLQGWGGGRADSDNATVRQSGTDQVSVVMQRNYPSSNYGNNSASVTQSGQNQSVFAYQYGQENNASITQTGTDTNVPSSSVKDSSTADNGGAFAVSFHGVDQTQSHLNDAGARIIQDEAKNNSASLSQSGGDDKGTVMQWYAERNTANLNQSGTNNAGVAYQTGHDSTINISQSNANNKASVFQVSGDQDGAAYGVVGADDSYNNTASVDQSGQNGTALILQGGSNNAASINEQGSGPKDGTIRQVGTSNNASINQNYSGTSGEHALTLQSGFNNRGEVSQSSPAAYSYLTQDGSGNVASVTQSAQGASPAYFAVSKIDQSGTNNTSNVNQTGNNTFSDLKQYGTGVRNMANVTQTAYNAVSYGMQNGGGNTMNVYQH